MSPPPVPPRRETFAGTLPRAQSMSLPRHTRLCSTSQTVVTVVRRDSDREQYSVNPDPDLNLNGNGDDETTPELPPKTYKMPNDHARCKPK